jgi:hypothetical protein
MARGGPQVVRPGPLALREAGVRALEAKRRLAEVRALEGLLRALGVGVK